jgi:hypothetical protein
MKVASKASSPDKVTTGLRQEDALSYITIQLSIEENNQRN